VSAVIAWTCRDCGHHADNLDIDTYMASINGHTCRVADVIRRAAAFFRGHSTPTGDRVAAWLEHSARQADRMSDFDDWGACAEPASAQHALAVARTVPWEQP
jgi:hypothetical protein